MLGQRHGCGDPADDPIFIVGLPRAGSTLLEQVLSSHSQVEGTTELPDILALVRQLSGPPKRSAVRTYPAVLATLPDDELRSARPTLPGADTRPAPHRGTALHRQDAQQLAARRLDPLDTAQRENRGCATSPPRLLLLELQAALRPRSALHVRPARSRPLLRRLRAVDEPFRRGAARADPSCRLRAHGHRHRARDQSAARLLRPRVRGVLPAVLREPASRAYRKLPAGAIADLPATPSTSGVTTSPGSTLSRRRSDRC